VEAARCGSLLGGPRGETQTSQLIEAEAGILLSCQPCECGVGATVVEKASIWFAFTTSISHERMVATKRWTVCNAQ
jgi:hypothetical protein